MLIVEIYGRLRLTKGHQLALGVMAVPDHDLGREVVLQVGGNLMRQRLGGGGGGRTYPPAGYDRFGNHSGTRRYGSGDHDTAAVILRRIRA